MINIPLRFPKFQVFEYDSRRGHIPNNLSVLNDYLPSIVGDLLRRDVNLVLPHSVQSAYQPTVVYSDDKKVFMSRDYVILYTIQKYAKKRIDSGKKRIGDMGMPVTKFMVAYGSHVIVRCTMIPKKLIKSYTQHPKHFEVKLVSYADVARNIV